MVSAYCSHRLTLSYPSSSISVLGQLIAPPPTPSQCQPSTGHFLAPNIPDSYFETRDINANEREGFSSETIYTITTPGLPTQQNCDGIVVGVDFCYFAFSFDIDFKIPLELFSLVMLAPEDESHFRVEGRKHVTAIATDSLCEEIPSEFTTIEKFICCDTMEIERIEISLANFTFGVFIESGSGLIGLHNFAPIPDPIQIPSLPHDGESFLVEESDRVSGDLLPLVRIRAGMFQITIP